MKSNVVSAASTRQTQPAPYQQSVDAVIASLGANGRRDLSQADAHTSSVLWPRELSKLLGNRHGWS